MDAILSSVLAASLLLGRSPAVEGGAGREAGPNFGQDVGPATEAGLTVRFYRLERAPATLPTLVPGQTPNVDVVLPGLDLADAAAFPAIESPFLAEAIGWLDVGSATSARFRLISDDGARLALGGRVVVDHDGRHGASPKDSAPIALAPGRHPLRVDYFDGGGKRALRLAWSLGEGEAFVPIPATALRCETDPTRVTAPGTKRTLEMDAPARRPGDTRPLEALHPAFRREPGRPADLHPKVGALTFLPDGRLVVGVFDPLQRDEERLPDISAKAPDHLLAIEGLGGDPARITSRVIADGLYEPCGLVAVGKDLYVSHRLAITRLRDLDGDGVFEDRHDVASGWEGWNYHQFTFGLVHVPSTHGGLGTLYATLSTAMAPPAWQGMGTNAAPNGVGRGTVIAVDLDSETWRVVAGGVRTPNGIGLGPEGTIVYCDNQGTWFPTSTLSIVEEGRFFGHYNNANLVPKLADRFPAGGSASVWCDRPRAPAAVYLPHNECANSPTQPLLVPSGPWAGQLLVGDVTAGGLHRIALERVGSTWQGVVLRCSQGLECGVNRLAWAPDGALLVGGIGAQGNWNWKGTQFGLERLVPTGVEAFEMLDVRAVQGGFDVRFTKPVDPASLAAPGRVECTAWRYRPTAAYGGPKIDEHRLTVTAVEPAADGRSARIRCNGLEAGTCVHLRVDAASTTGEAIWSTDAWYTMNVLPGDPAPFDDDGHVGMGALPPARAMQLVGRSADGMLVEPGKGDAGPRGGRSQAELMTLDGVVTVEAGKRLVTKTLHRDVRLHVEWRAEGDGAAITFGDAWRLPLVVQGEGWRSLDLWLQRDVAPGTTKTDVLVTDGAGVATMSSPAEAFPPSPLGFLAPAEDGRLQLRNVWVAPLRSPEFVPGPWVSLMDDPSGDTWQVRGGQGRYALERSDEGTVIVGSSVPDTANTFLATRRTYRDFELLVDVRQDVELNSGIQVRSELDGGPGKRDGRLVGYQVELDPSDRAFTGGLYDEARRAWLVPLTDMPYARQAARRGGWNRIRVLAEGSVLRTWVNGIPAAVLVDDADREGVIGLQVHGVGGRREPLTVRWRDLRIRDLTPTAPAAGPSR